MTQYVAQRMMDMDVESLCAAVYAERSVLVSEAPDCTGFQVAVQVIDSSATVSIRLWIRR
jgi:hypothetical protein